MPKPAPLSSRRTAERILECTLALFNRFGEPNVSTTLISSELGISPGNLYYHYPAKDTLINTLADRHGQALAALLPSADNVRDVEDAWFFMHSLFEQIWHSRFLYRDVNDLISNNRHLEAHFQTVLASKTRAVKALLAGLAQGRALQPDAIDHRDADAIAASMVVVLTFWLSFEYVRDPRHALEPQQAQAALLGGAQHVLRLLLPYLEPAQRQHLRALMAAYHPAE